MPPPPAEYDAVPPPPAAHHAPAAAPPPPQPGKEMNVRDEYVSLKPQPVRGARTKQTARRSTAAAPEQEQERKQQAQQPSPVLTATALRGKVKFHSPQRSIIPPAPERQQEKKEQTVAEENIPSWRSVALPSLFSDTPPAQYVEHRLARQPPPAAETKLEDITVAVPAAAPLPPRQPPTTDFGAAPWQPPTRTFGAAPQQAPTIAFGAAPQQAPTIAFGAAPQASTHLGFWSSTTTTATE